MGLSLDFYRKAVDPDSWFPEGYDCSCNGESIRFPSCVVINVDGPVEPSENKPAMMLVDDKPTGKSFPKLVPVDLVDGEYVRRPGCMFGGNYAATSDSRLPDSMEDMYGMRLRIIPVFDRVESE